MPQTYSSQFNAILDTQAPTLLSELELTSFCVSNGTFDRFLQYPRKLILLNDMIFNSEIWRCNVKTVKNNLWILSHVYKAVPTYTAGIMAYNAIRALVVVGDLWACKLVIGWLTQYQIGATGILFAGIALFYGLYVLLDYLGNQLNILLMNRYSSIRSIDLSKYMRGLLYHKLEEVELSCYEEKDFYDDLGRVLSEIDTRPVQVVNSFATGLYNLLTLVLITVIIFDPVFIAAALLYVVKHFWHIRKVNRINYEMDRDTQTSMRKVWYIKDLFKNREFIKEARNYQSEDFFIHFGESGAKEDYAISTAYNRKGARTSFLMILIGNLVNLLVVVYLCWQMLAGRYMPGDFVYLISSFSAFITNLSGLAQIVSEMQTHSMYIENITKILDYESPRIRQANDCAKNKTGVLVNIPTNTTLPEHADAEKILAENVNFRYGNGAIVLQNMNLRIEKGEKVALVGRNGSGKSTLVKLLMDFYPIQEGQILYNGVPYSRFDVGQLTGKFSAVFQDSPIYALSIAENVLMRELLSASDEKLVMEALVFSGLWKKVNALENGIHTILTKEFDDEGIYLSGGEYQKLIIARAYAHQGEILVFDEPASSLDPLAEYELFHKMMRLGADKTVIYITHRMAAAVDADCIYYIEDGTVRERGKHEALMQLQGQYCQMYTIQMKGYE